MIPWATKQKVRYTIVFFLILIAVSFMPLYIVTRNFIDNDETCTDGIKNQDETEIDCGGICVVACLDDIQDLEVIWSRVFKVDKGLYDAVAFVENVNEFAGIRNLKYTFEIQGENGDIIYTRKGYTYVNQRERFVIFESGIRIGEDAVPSKVFFTVDREQDWVEVQNTSAVPITVLDKELLSSDESPRLNVTLANANELRSYSNLEVVALVEDLTGNVVGVASTFVDIVEDGNKKDVSFTWVNPLPGGEKTSCNPEEGLPVEYLFPADVMLVFDRSGSMNDDLIEPPQPITDAKKAAQLFIDKMQPVDQVGLVSFSTEASNPIDHILSLEGSLVKEQIALLRIGIPDNQEHTNLGAGIRYAAQELNSERHNDSAKKAMVVLTDGIASRPLDPEDLSDDDIYPQKYARAQAEGARSDNIMVYVIGLGDNVDKPFLENYIASASDRYFQAANSSELAAIYAEIALAVCQDRSYVVKIFVRADSVNIR